MQKKCKDLVLAVIITMLISVSVGTYSVYADTSSNIGISVNNQLVSCSVAPVYSNGVILVGAKELMAALGGSFDYDSNSMTGTVKQAENEIVFRLDDSVVKINGKYIQATAPMKILGYRFMIPVEFVSQKLGADVYMNAGKNLFMIFKPIDGKIIYQVAPGDTLWIISRLFGTTISSLKQLNGMTGDTLYVNQKLVIKYYTPFSSLYPAQTTSSATLRSGPGFSFSEMNYLQAWTDITVAGKNGNWYKAATPKGNGYIYYSIVRVKQDIRDTLADSTFFDKEIPVDTSKDYVTYSTYTVQKGDSIWSISEDWGILDYELAGANNLTINSAIFPGQILKVPVHGIEVKSTLGPQYGELLDWFKEGQYVFPIDTVGKFIDMETGRSFTAKRTMGANHSDTETLTAQDTQVMKEIFGGSWTWNRRPFILEVSGRRFAVSVSGMPHAGVDGLPYLQDVSNRSGDFGYGPNYDRISGNGMNGHFDVYFMNCLRHVDSKIDPGHQYTVLAAGGLQ